jgi:hypothetical protein
MKARTAIVLILVALFGISLWGQSNTTGVLPNPCQNPAATLHICSLSVVGVSGTTPTFSLVYGTGTNCATGQTVLLGAWTTAANTVYTFSGPVGIVPSGQALCYLDTGTTPVQRVLLTYVQQ